MTSLSGATQDEIAVHYDTSNDFYRLWLDEQLNYSCALWLDQDNATLEQAQHNKLRFHLDNLQLPQNGHLLDIGCGWGSLLNFSKQHYSIANAVGLTLSKNQHQHICCQSDTAISVHLVDWNEYVPAQQFDGIVSIGAFEHFARPEQDKPQKLEIYSRFFQRCANWLKPGASLSLQTIAYGTLNPTDANCFIQNEIFPGSELPTLEEIERASCDNFIIKIRRSDPKDYGRTCCLWLRNLQRNRKKVIELVGEKTLVRYEYYLRLSAIGFNTGKITLLRMLFEKIV